MKGEKGQLKSSEKTAEKVYQVWEVLAGFTDEDVENLKKAADALREQNSKLEAVAGILIDLDRSDYQIGLNKLRIKRVNALLTLLENREKDWELGADYLKKKKQQEAINKAFGL